MFSVKDIKKAPTIFWIILAIFLGSSMTVIAFGIATSKSFKFQHGQTSINFDRKKAQQLNLDRDRITEDLNRKIDRVEAANRELKKALESKQDVTPKIKQVQQAIDELEPVAEEVEDNSEELKELVESAIEP